MFIMNSNYLWRSKWGNQWQTLLGKEEFRCSAGQSTWRFLTNDSAVMVMYLYLNFRNKLKCLNNSIRNVFFALETLCIRDAFYSFHITFKIFYHDLISLCIFDNPIP